jgi:hypothetical protein
MPQKKTFIGDSAFADARAFVNSQEVPGLTQRKVTSLKRVDSCIEKATKSIEKAMKPGGDSSKLTVAVTVDDRGEFEQLEWKSKFLQSTQKCSS